jgi:hypothetical protein
MIVELQRFIEFKNGWFGEGRQTREYMLFEPILLNTEYIASVKRYEVHGGFEFCQMWMSDRGCNWVVDKTYEEMRDLLMSERRRPSI